MTTKQLSKRRLHTPRWTPETACSPGCPGWAVFNGNEIQRCDVCARFKDDDAAIEHVIQIERREIRAQLKQGRRGAR